MNINPTRMELTKTKKKLGTAQKGYKLLKDKTNELIRRYYEIIQENRKLRIDVEQNLKEVFKLYLESKGRISDREIELLLSMPNRVIEVDYKEESILNFPVPKLICEENIINESMPYSPLSSNTTFDFSIEKFYTVVPNIINLAEKEKKAMLMANEIEKCKRRVNALENILIPKYEETIKQIEFKLGENERNSITTLIKLKDDDI